ncbi:LOW QUALITY PROTEIN: Protein hairy, partial [Gryllus bimaculatus]
MVTERDGVGAASAPAGGGCVPPGPDSALPPPRRSGENRRSNKPIMEKRRRARINNCLNELKSLILDAMKKDPARHSKLEKADILEMTVKHLETLQRQQAAMSAATDPAVVNKFRAGFSECAGEVGRFPGLESAVRRRLLQHLANCLNGSTASAPEAAAAAPASTTRVRPAAGGTPRRPPASPPPAVQYRTFLLKCTGICRGGGGCSEQKFIILLLYEIHLKDYCRYVLTSVMTNVNINQLKSLKMTRHHRGLLHFNILIFFINMRKNIIMNSPKNEDVFEKAQIVRYLYSYFNYDTNIDQ